MQCLLRIGWNRAGILSRELTDLMVGISQLLRRSLLRQSCPLLLEFLLLHGPAQRAADQRYKQPGMSRQTIPLAAGAAGKLHVDGKLQINDSVL